MAESSLYSLAHMLAEQEGIRVQIKVLNEKDEALERLIEAARAYEVAFGQDASQTSVVTRSQRVAGGVSEPHEINPRLRVRERARRPAPITEATEKLALGVLEAMGEPLQTHQIMDLIGPENLNLPNEKPLNVLSARLSNSSKFQGRRGKGWWFADQPWPGEQDNANNGVNESGPQNGSDPVSDPDNGGLLPDHFDELLGGNSNFQPGLEGHEEKEGGA